MALYLVQHGKNLPKDVDPDKSLSDEGRSEVERIATVAKGYNVPVSSIRHSGKKRAEETARIFADALEPAQGVSSVEGIGPMDDVAAFAGTIDPEGNGMVVGHLPFMEKLTGFLITGDADKPVFKFQNGGILCLDRDEDADGWVIRWSLMPHIG